jgi:acid phosphatase type 7
MKAIQGRFRAAVLMGAAASVLAFAAGANAQNQNFNGDPWQQDASWLFGNPAPNDNTWPYATTDKSPVLAVVGDIACQPGEEVSEANGLSTTTGEASKEVCTDPSTSKGAYTKTSLWQSQEATANQIETMKPAAVALLGDLQYQVGLYSDFMGSFDLTYGALKFLERPAPGNHEFYDEHGETGVAGYGYFSYYNGFLVNTSGVGSPVGSPITTTIPDPCPPALTAACSYSSTNSTPLIAQPVPRADGQAGHFEEPPAGVGVGVGDGWYSYNLGSWHLISLNIECSTQQPGGCPAAGAEPSAGSWLASELAWLEKDLEENHAHCTAAYWHQPTFSATNSITPEGVTAQLFWQMLYEHKADLVLNGHDHLYARYQPLEPDGTPNQERGIREFIVGTGGETLDPIAKATVTSGTGETNMEDPSGNTSFNATNLEAYTGDYWGVMALTLDPNGYRWDFESALAGPTVALNGPTLPAPTANGGYSDKGFGTCHGPVNW